MNRVIASFVLLALGFTSAPALCCFIVFPQNYSGSAQQRRDVRNAINDADAIIDGEVVRAWTNEAPALVRVAHVLRGHVGEFVEVGGPSAGGGDCTIALDRRGERSRMILTRSRTILGDEPARYDLFYDQSEARLEDSVLKSDRRKVWPYYSGQAVSSN